MQCGRDDELSCEFGASTNADSGGTGSQNTSGISDLGTSINYVSLFEKHSRKDDAYDEFCASVMFNLRICSPIYKVFIGNTGEELSQKLQEEVKHENVQFILIIKEGNVYQKWRIQTDEEYQRVEGSNCNDDFINSIVYTLKSSTLPSSREISQDEEIILRVKYSSIDKLSFPQCLERFYNDAIDGIKRGSYKELCNIQKGDELLEESYIVLYINHLKEKGLDLEADDFIESIFDCLINEYVIGELDKFVKKRLESASKFFMRFQRKQKEFLKKELVGASNEKFNRGFRDIFRKRIKERVDRSSLKNMLEDKSCFSIGDFLSACSGEFEKCADIILIQVYTTVLKECDKRLESKDVGDLLEKFKACLDEYVQKNFSLEEKPREVAVNEIEIPGVGQQLQNDTTTVRSSNEENSSNVLQPADEMFFDNSNVEVTEKEASFPERNYDDLLDTSFFSNLKNAKEVLQKMEKVRFLDNLFCDLCTIILVLFREGKNNEALEICKKLFKEGNLQHLCNSSKQVDCNAIKEKLGKLAENENEETINEIKGYFKVEELSGRPKRGAALSFSLLTAIKGIASNYHIDILKAYRFMIFNLSNKKEFDIAIEIGNQLLAIYYQFFDNLNKYDPNDTQNYDLFVKFSFLNLNDIKEHLEQLRRLEYNPFIKNLLNLALKEGYNSDREGLIDELFLTLDNMAHGLERKGEYDKALEIYKELLNKRKEIMPSGSIVIDNRVNIASVLVNKYKNTPLSKGREKVKKEAMEYCQNMLQEDLANEYNEFLKNLKEEILSSEVQITQSNSPTKKDECYDQLLAKGAKRTVDMSYAFIQPNFLEVLKYAEQEQDVTQVGKQFLEVCNQVLAICGKLEVAKGKGYELYGPLVDGFLFTLGNVDTICKKEFELGKLEGDYLGKSNSKSSAKKQKEFPKKSARKKAENSSNLVNKTQHKQPIHENLLSPREQSMRLNDIDETMAKRGIQKYEEKYGDPATDMDEVEVSGNKTEIGKG